MPRCLILLLLAFTVIPLHSQTYNLSSWMENLDDQSYVAGVSVPGTHDSATGEGMCVSLGFGVTQALGIEEQWECGIRAFDLRPAVSDTTLHIYHGRLRTKVSFAEVLDVICTKLEENPGEFAIVLIREESDSENEQELALWPILVGRSVSGVGDRASVFSPGLKVADVRGKILFLFRDACAPMESGARVTGWDHSRHGSTNAQIKSNMDASVARLQVQDYYAPTNDEKRSNKQKAVLRFLSLAGEAPPDVWTINFLSGYSTTWLGFTPLATTSGYKRNAAWLHPSVLSFLKGSEGSGGRRLGIVFMDYAGVDSVRGGLWHWGRYKVDGGMLVRAVIESNSFVTR